jgi:hypothetical protein
MEICSTQIIGTSCKDFSPMRRLPK